MTGQLPPDVAEALLLALNPPDAPTSFTSTAVNYDELLGTTRVNYDPTQPMKKSGEPGYLGPARRRAAAQESRASVEASGLIARRHPAWSGA